MNSTAVFTDAMPEKMISDLEKIKKSHPDKYEKELEKSKRVWAEKL